MNTPTFLLSNPAPVPKQRLYNGRKLLVWEGKVKISSIQGWVDNPRIEVAKKKLKSKYGDRDLTQTEIFDLMKADPELQLGILRDDIMKNGLREPLMLSFQGRLLDGNRRFFAVKYALETAADDYPNKKDLEIVDAYVLSEDATNEEEHYVLVEENFSSSLKLPWPDYVKATKIIEANEQGLSVDQISKKFSWPKNKVRETLRINEIVVDFVTFAISTLDPEDEFGGGLGLSENEVEGILAKNYQFFNEAQKSFFEPLKTDIHFKFQFFKWISEDKFKSWPEIRVAYKAWKNPMAREALMQPESTAAKDAKAIIDYDSRVYRSTEAAATRIEDFARFLNDMSAKEIKALPSSSRDKLQEALELMIKMTKAASAE